MTVLLASGSPRRAKILMEQGIRFEIVRTDAPEVSYPTEPERTVAVNALAKGAAARAAVGAADARPILSADTIVWCGGKIYGKPRDLAEARQFLRELSGRTHTVFTGVACDGKVAVQTSAVTFRHLTDEEIEAYVERVNPLDRAGAYDIDFCGEDLLIDAYSGSYENIMGLPLEPLTVWNLTPNPSPLSPHPYPLTPASPVGFFDSGLGGLCILEAFKRLCPTEATVYLADSANCPYGARPAEEILALARAHTKTLREAFGCKMIVVACNTATAAAIDVLRQENPGFPFVGLEPALKPAAAQSTTGIVGVLATKGTFGGRLYNETKAKFAREVNVIATCADEFVELVESQGLAALNCRVPGDGLSREDALNFPVEAEQIVRAKIEPLLAAGCDRLVLGCTHFPHVKGLINKVAQGRAEVIDPSEAVARQAQRLLAAHHLTTTNLHPPHIFLSNKLR